MKSPPPATTAIQIPAVDAPGRLDMTVLQGWGRAIASQALRDALQGAAIATETVRVTASTLPGPDHWQHPPDALWMDAQWARARVQVCVPLPLALAICARCLGYDRPSEQPLTDADRRRLAGWLQPLVGWIAASAGWSAEPRLTVRTQPHIDGPSEAELVLFSISLSAGDEHGTLQLAAPWPELEPSVRQQVAAADAHLHISPAVLRAVPLEVEAIIPGGTVSVADSLDIDLGDVLVLDAPLQGAVDVRLGGRTVVTGRLGSQNGKWAVRTTQVNTDTILGRNGADQTVGES